MQLAERYIDKLRHMKYLNRGIVFGFDMILSVLGTVLSYVFILSLNSEWKIDDSTLTLLICSASISLLLFMTSGIYKVIIRHASLEELIRIVGVMIIKNVFLVLIAMNITEQPHKWVIACSIIDMLISVFLMIGLRASIVSVYYYLVKPNNAASKNAFVYSSEGSSPLMVEQINRNMNSQYHVKGYLTTDKQRAGIKISGTTVYYIENDKDQLSQLFRKNNVNYLIFTSVDHLSKEKENMVEFCINHHVKMLIAGGLKDVDKSGNFKHDIKPIQIEDLLGRAEIEIDTEKIKEIVHGKTILVTGAAGSIGSEIVNQLTRFGVGRLVLVDNAETPLHNLQLTLRSKGIEDITHFCLGDVRSSETMRKTFDTFRPEIVFHAAAYKHVPMIEANPCEAILDNVWGTLNVAKQSIQYNVKKFVMISTDKAVNPTNVMGASKRIAEMCTQYFDKHSASTQFITTRFGNVLGSNGSVIPLFKKQIANGGPVTVTDPRIIRYFMTIPEACRLVLQAATLGTGGEVFVFDMGEQVEIVDLARKMISLSGLEPDKDIKIEFTGLRPGEKLYEELLSDKEQTLVTSHHKIRMAPASMIDYEMLDQDIKQLVLNARKIDIETTVKLMKKNCA